MFDITIISLPPLEVAHCNIDLLSDVCDLRVSYFVSNDSWGNSVRTLIRRQERYLCPNVAAVIGVLTFDVRSAGLTFYL